MKQPTKIEASDNGVQGDRDVGPGWMPAILATMALLGIVAFVTCAASTWFLFQKRTELAIRTLQGSYLTQLEQSRLDPETKSAVTAEIKSLIDDLEKGKYENWQAAGIMQRLQRMPLLQWGELQAIESFLKTAEQDSSTQAEATDGLQQLKRMKRAVENGKVTSFDLEDVLQPVRIPSPQSPSGLELALPLPTEGVRESVRRAKLVSDRSQIAADEQSEVSVVAILRKEIEQGATTGGY